METNKNASPQNFIFPPYKSGTINKYTLNKSAARLINKLKIDNTFMAFIF